MSVLIKGMTRPKNCFECHLTKWIDDGRAGCFVDNKIHDASRPIDCPLVEISEPHGRLIDESRVIDAIHERLEVLRTHEAFRRKRGDIDLLGVMPYIAKIPTVIEAEGGEDE